MTSGSARASVHLLDQSGAGGIGLAEIYRLPLDSSVIASDLVNSVSGALLNLSLRAQTGPGEGVATVGFVTVDPQSKGRSLRLLLRVVGPSLASFGVGGALADPVLTLYNAKGEVIARNDNWSDNANSTELAAATTHVGAFGLAAGSKDAALLLDLPAGIYSIQATAADGTPVTGVTLTEIYLVR